METDFTVIKSLLYPHQRDFLTWAEGRTGGILADEMGLG